MSNMSSMKETKEQQVAEKEKKDKENSFNPSDYSCEVLLEKTTKDKAVDKKFPSDAYIVKYIVGGKELMDVTRSAKPANIFDLYYDKYGKGALQAIEWGYGTVNPSQWGYKHPEKKKRRRKDG